MKKLFSIFTLVGFALCSFGTGVTSMYPPNIVGQNPSQAGTVQFSGTNQSVTTTFPFAFPVLPAMQIYPQNIGELPYTNTVTLTNFTLLIAGTNVGVGSNNIVYWIAQTPYQRIQTGSQVVSSGLTVTNVTFPVPYSTPPTVVVTSGTTNAPASAYNITTTNFVLTVESPTTNQWMAIGQCLSPGLNAVNQ